MELNIDVSGLVPAARPVARAAAQVYCERTRPWFVGLVCFGSTVKGGLIPGASDIDFHLYLDDAAFTEGGALPLEVYFQIRRDLARIDPAPLRYIDGSIERVAPLAEGHIGPVPGAYHVVAGRLPVPEATAWEAREQARWALDRLDPMPRLLTEGLLHHGGSRGALALTVRAFSQGVWPALYQVLCLQHPDPLEVWRLPKADAVELLAPDGAMGREIRSFHAALRAYYPSESSLEDAFAVIRHGVAFLESARESARPLCA